MHCPNCTNEPRSGLRFMLPTGLPSFTCYHCNVLLKGNAVILLLDLFSLVLSIGLVVLLLKVVLKPGEAMTLPVMLILSVFGIALIKLIINYIQDHMGRYKRYTSQEKWI